MSGIFPLGSNAVVPAPCARTFCSECSSLGMPSPVSCSGGSLGPTPTFGLLGLPRSVIPPGLAFAHVVPWKQAYGMEQVWLGEFGQLFSSYLPHRWSLVPVSDTPLGSWNQFVDSAKVRFCCEECGHGWTSMKGRVAFWFAQAAGTAGAGVVAFRLYGQQCERCKSGRFQDAMWYPEEVVKVLMNLYNRVGQTYYGFFEPPIQKARRTGKPRTPHNVQLCQACHDGVCTNEHKTSPQAKLLS
ncbi:receptor-transporting protein 4-like isoform X1 [Varroa jacobsoni]|uniref:receptor-transporting protein 4-like isoform X1 n=2 Tax=Varroa jacobsoni TaxID=62625 RepID=UPI000BF26EF3|nr:receptor-transporting protein 4-like isoform X1 [Varroa jacobsoni]